MSNTLPTTSRRALVIVAYAILFAFCSIIMRESVNAWHPPQLAPLLFGFLAFFVGLAGFYMLRRQPGVRPIRAMAILVTLYGLATPFIFSLQSLHWRAAVQDREIANVREIAAACHAYASNHNREFSPSLDGLPLPLATFCSPLGGHTGPKPNDYAYAGAGITAALWRGTDFDPNVITVYSTEARLGDNWTVGFADGSAKMLSEQDFGKAIEKSNEIRVKAGLAPAKFALPWKVANTPS